MKSIYSFIFVICIWPACCTVSCTHPKPDPEALGRAEATMETAPDSALALLSTFDTDSLSGVAQRARYALLMSMALDKNGIDTTSFNIIQPAIDYYLYHGTPDEILRTRYYQGRIFQNAGLRDSAIHCFLKAIELAPYCNDSLCLARAFVAQGCIYNDLYDFEKVVMSNLKAAGIYDERSKPKQKFDCFLKALNGAILQNDKVLVDSIMKLCNQFEFLDDSQTTKLLGYRITYLIEFGTNEDLNELISNPQLISNLDINGYLNLAYANNKLGHNETAKYILEEIDKSNVVYDTLKYQSIRYLTLKDIGDYKEALRVYEKFNYRLDSINYIRFSKQAQILNDKHLIELKAEKDARQKSQIVWLCIVIAITLLMGVFILLLLLRSNRTKKELALEKARTRESENIKLKSESEKLALEKERLALESENLAYRVEKLEEESDQLKTIIDSHEELPQEVKNAIKIRIEMLNSLLAGYITANNKYEKPYDKWVRDLTDDIDKFMNSNRLAFQASHPRFIQYFEERGLTTEEINYICLYAIGLKGKEIGNYMKRPSHVNTSSAIRKKLGIDKHDTNIGIYVRKLLESE